MHGPNVSVTVTPGLAYPEKGSGFSPDTRYPEYRFDTVSPRPNAVYGAVRELFVQLGLDRERLGTPEWNPLGEYVKPGASVFVLCNFVYHMRPQDDVAAMRAKCIHGSVLRALTDYVLIATGPGGRVRFGNSPLQSCDWQRVLAESEAGHALEFYTEAGAPVEPSDLRLRVAQRTVLGRVTEVRTRDESALATEFDLGDDSYLARLARGSGPAPRFRVADYDPARIEAFHRGTSHRYVIHRDIIDADVVISLPKLKTHEKVGITCGLKGFVGTVGHKDCLAHHRFGNPSRGGDEYPDRFWPLRYMSAYHDWLNHRGPDAPLQGLFEVGERSLRRVIGRLPVISGGGWHGNDTCWRMVVDLARIVQYGDAEGRMRDEPQRRHLMLIDGVTAGEGHGPLVPVPVEAGTLLFADNVVVGDRVACRGMGYDPDLLPMIHECGRLDRFRLVPDGRPTIVVNGEAVDETAVRPVVGRAFRPPPGWDGRLERTA